MTNEAFSLELYLKCLYRIRRRHGRGGHNVSELFNGLSKRDRENIERHVNEVIDDEPAFTRESVRLNVPIDIASILQRTSNMFPVGRYWHEGILPSPDAKGNRSNLGTTALIEAIVRAIYDVHPEWEGRRIKFVFGGAPKK
jgi:hypothetical protein